MSRTLRLTAALACATLLAAAAPQEVNTLVQALFKDPHCFPIPGNTAEELPLRDVGQTVWALQLANRNVEAAQLAETALHVIDVAKTSGRPTGSAPPTALPDGTTSLPRCYVDAQAVAAILEAAWRHAATLDPKSGAAWTAKWWPQIFAAGDFVVNWTRGPRGEPYPAFDPTLNRDFGGPFESPGALLGLLCAQKLAGLAGKPVPETWQQRNEALQILVRTTDFTDATRAQRLPWGLPDLRGILPEDHPLWLAPVILNGDPKYVRQAASANTTSPTQKIITAMTAK